MDNWDYEPAPLGRPPIGVWNTGRFTYVTNLEHSVVRDAYETRKRELGVPSYSGLTPLQRVKLDWELVERFGIDERTPNEVIRRLKDRLYTDLTLAATLSK